MSDLSPTKERVLLYVRISTPKQETSIGNQISMLQHYCDLNNLEVVKIYSDTASGTKPFNKRPGASQMLKRVMESNGEIKTIVYVRQDRLTRNKDDLKTMESLEASGVKWKGINDHFDRMEETYHFLKSKYVTLTDDDLLLIVRLTLESMASRTDDD